MKIVDKCYNDFLSNVQDKLNVDKEYVKAKSKYRQALKQIKNVLTPNQLKFLIEYNDCIVDVNAIVMRKYYTSGFNYGRKLFK